MEEINLDYDTLRLFTISDLYVVPITLGILIWLARLNFKYDGAPHLKRYYYWAFFLKIICVFIYAALVQFYWQISDSKRFYIDLIKIQNAAETLPELWRIVYFDAKTFIFDYSSYVLHYMPAPASVYLYRLVLPLSFFCFNSYLAIGMCINFFSFLGTWKIFKVFIHKYPGLVKEAAFSSLFYPSILFWSSIGIMKDPITFGALGFLLYGIYWLVQGKRNAKYIVMALLSAWVIFLLKSYILIAFLAGTLLWVMFSLIGKIRYKPLRTLVVLVSFSVIVIGAFFFFQNEADATAKGNMTYFNTEQIISAASGLKEEYTRVEAGSNFDVDIDYSTTGLLQFIPMAMVITLFRPFVWEASNFIMLLGSLEGLFVLGFCLFLLIKGRLFQKIGGIFKHDKFIIMLLVFPVLFFFTVAISTFNFGTMARYKIPALPFFIFLLFVLNKLTQNNFVKEKGIKKLSGQKRRVL